MAGNAFPPQIRPTQATKAAYVIGTVAVARQPTDARTVSNSAALERSDPCGPVWIGRTLTAGIVFNPRLGALRYVVWGAVGYLIFALGLVYVVAPIRGVTGAYFMADKLRYDAERWLATAV